VIRLEVGQESRPKCDGSENVRSTFVIDLGRERKRKKKREVRPLRILAMFERADQWQALLDSGEVVNRAALARRFGVSAMRVTQVLALLRLDRRVREAIFALPAGTKDRYVSERSLRPLLVLSPARQLRALGWLVHGKKVAG
jgi:hypothetical protein